MRAQDARTHTVNGRDPSVVDGQGLLVHTLFDKRATHAVANLGRGIFGKGNGEHLIQMLDKRTGFGRERVDDAAREGKGLARTGARRDKQRTVERLTTCSCCGIKVERSMVYTSLLTNVPSWLYEQRACAA